ncbi:MAG: 1,6-anhydro-N-acetylmuramyl-L-alanine amidase AmpD [Gammaproteobacteria bacterium]|nr:1,6-anhydro-N-acetylmuramyl-L-alanine amidase AmpD [Gammaproteobacteria bacterium]
MLNSDLHGCGEIHLYASPNCSPRPCGEEISLVVIHNISLPPGEFGGGWIDDLFLNRLDARCHPYFATLSGLRVSAHLLIRRDGVIHQYVPFSEQAWHAGVSLFAGRERCNEFSIGIELEGTDTTPYSDRQYQQLGVVLRQIMQRYPMVTPASIVGHQQIAPQRKTDPGEAFDWQRLRRLLIDAA